MSKWKSFWVAAYAVGLVLPPPIHFHDRLFFASEYLLIPLVFDTLLCLFKGELVRPPKALVLLWVVCLVAFIAGIFRGDLALKISIYDLGPFKYFSFKDDGIVFVRMLVLFSTPWLLDNFLKEDKSGYFKVFIKVFKISVLISAALAILDYQSIRLINLENLGYYNGSLNWWAFRAHGTFITPIEASFIYGAGVVYLLTSGESLANRLNQVVLATVLVALVLTHGGTALVGLVVSLGGFFYFERAEKKANLPVILGLVGLTSILGWFVLPHVFFLQKLGDFIYRQKTYFRYWSVLEQNPLIGLWGIGFSRVCTDNNFIGFVVQGGLLLFGAAINWIWKSSQRAPRSVRYVFLFWVVTWLSFDTVGYWGIGRLCWFLLGF